MSTPKASRAAVDVLDLLTSQHAEVDALFAQIEKADGDTGSLVIQLADKLAAHATIEEKIFYPGVMSKQTNDMLHESVEEHLEVKRLLADLVTMKIDHDDFMAKIKVLKENVTHHAHEEEEQKMFPLLRKSMSADELGALGSECLAMFEALMPQHPHKNLPRETAAAAPLPKVA